MSYTVVVPSKVWLLGIGMLVVIGGVALLARRLQRSREDTEEWHVPSVGLSWRQSLFARWDARLKVFSLLLFSFVTVSFISLRIVGLVFLWTLGCAVVAGLPRGLLLRRLKPLAILTLALVLILPLTAPRGVGTPTISIVLEPLGALTMNGDALLSAVMIGAKAAAVVIATTLMIETSPYATTIGALERLGVPSSIAQMLLLSYRYLFVLREEAKRMSRAMYLRGFKAKAHRESLQIIGAFVGTLFVRSFERMERISDAMRLRGYRGTFPSLSQFRATSRDWIITGIWMVVTIAAFILDYTIRTSPK